MSNSSLGRDYLCIGARSEQIDIIKNHNSFALAEPAVGHSVRSAESATKKILEPIPLQGRYANEEGLAYTGNAHHYLRYVNANGET